MPRGVLIFAFVVGILLSAQAQDATPIKYVGEPLLPILEVLNKTNLSGSLVFSGRCPLGYTPDFPPFRTLGTSWNSPLQSLGELVPDHPTMQVTQDKSQVIRMIELGVPTDILHLRISHIAFDGSGTPWNGAVYQPGYAMMTILRTPEVVAFMRAHDIKSAFNGTGGGVTGNPMGKWPPEHPHISGSLDNVTVAEALDHVLKAFPGIWVYENCPANVTNCRDLYLGCF